MDAKKIIMDLNYRIESADENDPERENAIRLRDRLLAKYGLRLEDLVEIRSHRTFEKLSQKESAMVGQYFRRKLNIKYGEAPYNLTPYKYHHRATKFNCFITIDLTDDEYRYHEKIVKNLVQIFRRKTRELEKKLREEAQRRRDAMEYAIYDKAGILFPAGHSGDSGSSFGLREAIMAARDLEDTVFPDLHIEQEFLKLAKEA